MSYRVAINGFGRMGRLAFRAAWDWPEFEIVHVNDIAATPESAAHLLTFDSVHGEWDKNISVEDNALCIDGKRVTFSSTRAIEDTPWKSLGVDVVVDCTGKFKSKELLQAYLDAGVKKVVVSAPVKDGTLNVVMGVNDVRVDEERPNIVTAASCTTNCIAPVIDVVHKQFGIKHGSITTVHDVTNTQSILDEYHEDLRRARACGQSLIPTSTGSATAIAEIFPELKGRLNGVAIRVPLANASITDCVFELEQEVTVEQVNDALRAASESYLQGVMGFETRPLVSVDYTNDKRSAIVDAPSTMVINGTQLKLLVWYDNEMGYVHRMMELVKKVGSQLV